MHGKRAIRVRAIEVILYFNSELYSPTACTILLLTASELSKNHWKLLSRKVFQIMINFLYFLFWDFSFILQDLFVCVEVLRPSQPNGVMSSAVSLLNHTFTGQA